MSGAQQHGFGDRHAGPRRHQQGGIGLHRQLDAHLPQQGGRARAGGQHRAVGVQRGAAIDLHARDLAAGHAQQRRLRQGHELAVARGDAPAQDMEVFGQVDPAFARRVHQRMAVERGPVQRGFEPRRRIGIDPGIAIARLAQRLGARLQQLPLVGVAPGQRTVKAQPWRTGPGQGAVAVQRQQPQAPVALRRRAGELPLSHEYDRSDAVR